MNATVINQHNTEPNPLPINSTRVCCQSQPRRADQGFLTAHLELASSTPLGCRGWGDAPGVANPAGASGHSLATSLEALTPGLFKQILFLPWHLAKSKLV